MANFVSYIEYTYVVHAFTMLVLLLPSQQKKCDVTKGITHGAGILSYNYLIDYCQAIVVQFTMHSIS